MRRRANDPINEATAKMQQQLQARLGALGLTGSPTTPSDEAPTSINLVADARSVIFEFGHPVRWLRLTPQQALELGNILINQAKSMLL